MPDIDFLPCLWRSGPGCGSSGASAASAAPASSKRGFLPTLADIENFIQAAAKKHQVPAAFVKSIVAAESAFNANAVSPKGAIGLMQLMPETARQYGADPSVPEQNVDAGTHYLRTLLDRYHGALKSTIAAYNAGPGAVDHYRGVPPFRETRGYVVRVLGFLKQFQRQN